MGVTVESKNHIIDLGVGGFNNLRKKIAELTAPDIAEHFIWAGKKRMVRKI